MMAVRDGLERRKVVEAVMLVDEARLAFFTVGGQVWCANGSCVESR